MALSFRASVVHGTVPDSFFYTVGPTILFQSLKRNMETIQIVLIFEVSISSSIYGKLIDNIVLFAMANVCYRQGHSLVLKPKVQLIYVLWY